MLKKISMLLGTITLAMVLFAGVSTSFAAPAPLIFELKISVKGHSLLDGEESKATVKSTVYMLYVWNGYFLAYQTLAGWEMSGKFDVFPYDTGKSISIYNHTTDLNLTADLPVRMVLNARIPYKEKDGEVVKAMFTSVGAMVSGSRIISGADFYGNGRIKGKMISFDKLPPEVKPLMI